MGPNEEEAIVKVHKKGEKEIWVYQPNEFGLNSTGIWELLRL